MMPDDCWDGSDDKLELEFSLGGNLGGGPLFGAGEDAAAETISEGGMYECRR